MKVLTSNKALFKFENFGQLTINNQIDKDDLWGEGDNWKLFLKENKELKECLKKIGKEMFGSGYKIKKDMFCLVNLPEAKEYDTLYVQVTGDSSLYFTEDFSEFHEDWNTEEKWGVKEWIEMI
jgi:hypothetical protein